MKERIQGIIIGIVITLFLIGTLSFASQHSEYVERFYKNIKITLNGINIEPKDVNGNIVEPFIIDGTTYLPVRAICKALGLEVNWNSETNTVELIEEKYNEISTEKNDTPIVSIKTQYGIENNDVIEKKDETDTTNAQTRPISNSDTKLEGTPTEMQKKALEDAKSRITNYNFYGISKKNLINYLSNKYINSEVKYAMDNIEVNWNEQALKCANSFKSSCGQRSTLRMMIKAYGFTEKEIEYAINHLGDFWKRCAVKRANMYNPDHEYMNFDGVTITYYKKTFEEYMKEEEFTDEEIEFAREELKYKQ